MPAVASANPSKIPITNTENPILFRYMGITGYSISLATSVNRLTNDNIQMVRVITFIAAKVHVLLQGEVRCPTY